MINLSTKDFLVIHGMRTALMIIAPTYKVKFNVLAKTNRGKKGFSSAGLKYQGMC